MCFLSTLKSNFDLFVSICYKLIRNAEIVGLEDFEMKIDQIAATENEVSHDGIGVVKKDDDSDWITNLYRQFNDPISSTINISEIPKNSSSYMR